MRSRRDLTGADDAAIMPQILTASVYSQPANTMQSELHIAINKKSKKANPD
jgi:hypothetical protein